MNLIVQLLERKKYYYYFESVPTTGINSRVIEICATALIYDSHVKHKHTLSYAVKYVSTNP